MPSPVLQAAVTALQSCFTSYTFSLATIDESVYDDICDDISEHSHTLSKENTSSVQQFLLSCCKLCTSFAMAAIQTSCDDQREHAKRCLLEIKRLQTELDMDLCQEGLKPYTASFTGFVEWLSACETNIRETHPSLVDASELPAKRRRRAVVRLTMDTFDSQTQNPNTPKPQRALLARVSTTANLQEQHAALIAENQRLTQELAAVREHLAATREQNQQLNRRFR